jgi:HlyD family type I secretion membrane fusion protein
MDKSTAEQSASLPQTQAPARTELAKTAPQLPVSGQSHDAFLREASKTARPAIVTGLVILACFFGGGLFFAVCVPLRADIHVPGELVFKTKRQTVQHLEGGIVKSILVKDGDTVQAGQPLIKLESNQVAPLVNMMDEQGVAELAFMARVEAESRDLPSIQYPRSLTGRAKDPAVARAIESENRLFAARRIAFQNQVQLLRLQIAEVKAAAMGTQERLATKKLEIASIKEQLEANQTLQKQGYVTNTVVLDLQRMMAAHSGEREVIVATMAGDKQRLAELEQRILALRAERVQGAINEAKQSSLRRIDQQERVRPLRDTLERQVIRAPVTGKVVGLKVTTIGGVIMPRETLMEIAPTGDYLMLEAKIRLEDVSEVKVGQLADVRVSGVDLTHPPILKARLTYISDDRLVGPSPQGPQSYYAAQLELVQDSLKVLGNISLKSGMSAQISIATKPRTPLTDILGPARERFLRALATR